MHGNCITCFEGDKSRRPWNSVCIKQKLVYSASQLLEWATWVGQVCTQVRVYSLRRIYREWVKQATRGIRYTHACGVGVVFLEHSGQLHLPSIVNLSPLHIVFCCIFQSGAKCLVRTYRTSNSRLMRVSLDPVLSRSNFGYYLFMCTVMACIPASHCRTPLTCDSTSCNPPEGRNSLYESGSFVYVCYIICSSHVCSTANTHLNFLLLLFLVLPLY